MSVKVFKPSITMVSAAVGLAIFLAPPPIAMAKGGGGVGHRGLFAVDDLYSSGGVPSINDIRQKRIGDCWLAASMGAVAFAQPDVIKNAISYDPVTQNFTVNLHDSPQRLNTKGDTADLKAVSVNITQDDVRTDIADGGVSRDTKKQNKEPLWPAILEAAYAKMQYGTVAAGLKVQTSSDGKKVHDVDGGTTLSGMAIVTGYPGTKVSPSSLTFDQLNSALAAHQPVTMSTAQSFGGNKDSEDGLARSHVYSVTAATNVGGTFLVTLRNPWGENKNVADLPPGTDPSTGYLGIDIHKLAAAHLVDSFDIGPKPEAHQ